MRSKDFREKAWNALKGNWGIAILASLIASALGGSDGSISFGGYFGGGSIGDSSSSGGSEAVMSEEIIGAIVVVGIGIILFAIAIAIASLIVAGPIWVGYSRFNLALIDESESKSIGILFSGFKNLKNAFLTKLLHGVYIALAMVVGMIPCIILLIIWPNPIVLISLVIPIIFTVIVSLDYSMTGFVLAEKSYLGPKDALAESKRLMNEKRGKLFSLDMSFIGWHLACICTLGIGYVFLAPYIEAAHAAFYREIKREDDEKFSRLRQKVEDMVDSETV